MSVLTSISPRIMVGAALAAVLLASALATPASAKKFRYSAGPKTPEDTVLSVAQVTADLW